MEQAGVSFKPKLSDGTNILTADRKKSQSLFQNLHKEAESKKHKLDRIREKKLKEKSDQEMVGVTFKPTISSKPPQTLLKKDNP